jgi:hypothetical protein
MWQYTWVCSKGKRICVWCSEWNHLHYNAWIRMTTTHSFLTWSLEIHTGDNVYVQDGCSIIVCRSWIEASEVDRFVTVMLDFVGNAEEAQFLVDEVTSPPMLTGMLNLKISCLWFVDAWVLRARSAIGVDFRFDFDFHIMYLFRFRDYYLNIFPLTKDHYGNKFQ